ncbi:MAG: phosphatidylserine decarboxylase [Pseudomonadota bacterium]
MSGRIFIPGLAMSLGTLLPLAVKWELQKKIIVPAALVIGTISSAIAGVLDSFWGLELRAALTIEFFMIVGISGSFLLWRFFRDPDRVTPQEDHLVLSPADGKIIYVRRIDQGQVPFSEKHGTKFPLREFVQSDVLPAGGYILGIAMNYLDVHVNRAPIAGKITLLRHIKGLFISLKRLEAIIQNERVLTVIENGRFKVGIVQIASRLVRKIIPYLREGSDVLTGQRIGMIRFGSQVDLILPELESLTIEVTPGEKVKAGITVVATF